MDATLSASPNTAPSKLSVGKNVSIGIAALRKYGTPTSLELDLLNVASIIYAADLAVKRDEREDFVRSLELTLPVVNLAVFQAVKGKLEEILRVLSYDNWVLKFIAATGTPEANRTWPKSEGTTLLFSGGLDSFAGACDLLEQKVSLFLVSHVTHNRPVSNSQRRLVSLIQKHDGNSVPHLPLMIFCRHQRDFPFPRDTDREETQRTRSFLFVALAAVAARMNGSRRVLVMAENGQFAIHLPLNAARVGPFSTHTAHPEFLSRMQGTLRELLSCQDLTLTNPFEHRTKSEVVALVPKMLRAGIEDSISCWMTARLSTHSHCGECVPCISRRLALEEHNIILKEYKRDLLNEDIGSLPPEDLGKRNLTDILEFIARFYGPHAARTKEDLLMEFPELINPYVDQDKAIAMYRRFAKSATNVLKQHPTIKPLIL